MTLLFKKGIIGIIIVSLFTASCATVPYEQTASGKLDNYIGEHYYELILNYGPPTDIYHDGKDGRILEWASERESIRPGFSYSESESSTEVAGVSWDNFIYGEVDTQSSGYTISTPPRRVTSSRYFQMFVDSKGTVYNYRHNTVSTEEIAMVKKNERMKIIGVLGGAFVLGIIYGVANSE